MEPGPGEPSATSWQVRPLSELTASRPKVVAIDGRGGAGKTGLAERLRTVNPGAVVVHTDDVAWWQARFDWAELLIDGILRPVRAGRDVTFRPPAWEKRGRAGSIDVPAGSPLVIVEGSGSSRRELAPLIDVAVWVRSDFAAAERRALVRDMREQGTDRAAAQRNWDDWMAEELPFLNADRPWERADFIVAGTPVLDHDPAREVVTSDQGRRVLR